jgi:phosphatidylglycerophosphate synthase
MKMKIINKIQIFNSFIAFFSILFFIIILDLYIFTQSLNSVCTEATQNSIEYSNNQNRLMIIIIIALVIILWLHDSRDWHQIGSILFILSTIVTFLTMFYYSQIYQGISLLSFWLFIEWVIVIFNKKENSKNSFHYSFMKV